ARGIPAPASWPNATSSSPARAASPARRPGCTASSSGTTTCAATPTTCAPTTRINPADQPNCPMVAGVSEERKPPSRELSPGMREQLDLGNVFGGLSTFGQRPFLTDPEQLDA